MGVVLGPDTLKVPFLDPIWERVCAGLCLAEDHRGHGGGVVCPMDAPSSHTIPIPGMPRGLPGGVQDRPPKWGDLGVLGLLSKGTNSTNKTKRSSRGNPPNGVYIYLRARGRGLA